MDDQIASKAFVRIKNADVLFAGYQLPDGDHKLYTADDLEQARREALDSIIVMLRSDVIQRAAINYDEFAEGIEYAVELIKTAKEKGGAA